MTILDDQIRKLVNQSCLYLDDADWPNYLGLYTTEFTYRIVCYSPELRKDMVWMEQDRKGMTNLVNNLENHITRQGRFMHQVQIAAINPQGAFSETISPFLVVYTDLEGVTTIFAAGRYIDVIDTTSNKPLISNRKVVLDTRDLGSGSHFPI
tara:strand:- start:57 stop:512 length:456 start_codon:yes stop_codon:yes gene_type:complete